MKGRLKRLRRKKQLPYLELNLMPLIDVALNLLIIFMVATPMLKQENGLQIELPQGNVKETDDSVMQKFVVQIDKKGTVYLDGTKMEEKALLDALSKASGIKGERTVFVKADTGASYGMVIELIDKIKHIGGVRYVALATTKME